MPDTPTKIRAAEQLLYELARDLRFVPIEPRTMRVHLRALELKREVRAWGSAPPDEGAMTAVIDEARQLSDEARRLRAEVPNGECLARMSPAVSSALDRRRRWSTARVSRRTGTPR